jgi:hypothetical protein
MPTSSIFIPRLTNAFDPEQLDIAINTLVARTHVQVLKRVVLKVNAISKFQTPS